MFHWKASGALRRSCILDPLRGAACRAIIDDYDIILTTYGTLTRDAVHLKNIRFDYCILDEAQAVKNSSTLSAKAVRLLKADHRLALSGTPVENHLGELWSLFEFLNPGMLGSSSVFGGAGRNPDAPTRSILAQALRPFILRRTKGQVAKELPAKPSRPLLRSRSGHANFTTSCAIIIAPSCSRTSRATDCKRPNSKCSKPCCACAKRRVIRV